MSVRLNAIVKKYRWRPEFDGLGDIDPNQRLSDGDTLLHLVAASGDVEGIHTLIESGADINIAGDIGNTAVQYAAMRGHLNAVEVLLQYGADPMIENEFGDTALSWAETGGHTEIANIIKRFRKR